MSFSSVGYDGTVLEGPWSKLSTYAGGISYGVLDQNSWRADVVPNSDRLVSLTAGSGAGMGVADTTDAPETLPAFDTQATGVRYDLVVARRVWASNATSFAIIKGGSNPVLPARLTGFGTTDDQPLWLVPVVANGAGGALGIPIDLRLFQGESGAYARDKLALTYITRLGSLVRIGDDFWQRVLDGNGLPAWSRSNLRAVPAHGLGPGLMGNPPAGTDMLEQYGSAGQAADQQGYITITYPTPFPNGLHSAFFQNGDSTSNPGVSYEQAGGPWGFGSKTQVTVRAMKNGLAYAGGQHRVNYLLKGW